jgi:serine/threonine protein kinase
MNTIGNYRIIQKLGEGGVGEVFKALDPMLERDVAIKVLRSELSEREQVLQRFRSEAVALGRLNHPNIATVYNFAKDGSRYYMVLEYVNGESLDQLLLRRKKLSWQETVKYGCAVLDGLEHAHRLKVIHRDVKPSNILVSNTGIVKIMDFGIARILEKARQTQLGYLVGTLEYMSPEQIQGYEVDARADIYSFGIVMYEMLTGRLPFQKNTDYDLLKSQIEDTPQPLRFFVPDIPNHLEKIVLRSLAKNPADRFGSALEFRDALNRVLNSEENSRQFPPATRLVTSNADLNTNVFSDRPSRITISIKQFLELLTEYPIPATSLFVSIFGLTLFYLLSTPKALVESVSNKESNLIQPSNAILPAGTESNTRQINQVEDSKPVIKQLEIGLPRDLPKQIPPSSFVEPTQPKLIDVPKIENQPDRKKSKAAVKKTTNTKKSSSQTDSSTEKQAENSSAEHDQWWNDLRHRANSSSKSTKQPEKPTKSKQDQSNNDWQEIKKASGEFLKK